LSALETGMLPARPGYGAGANGSYLGASRSIGAQGVVLMRVPVYR
jgi:hypothetical protein